MHRGAGGTATAPRVVTSALARIVALQLGWLLYACASASATAAPSEYQVKAVFLFNFAQFVEWPTGSYRSPDSPFVIGVLGQDPFGSELDQVVRGETVNQRSFEVRHYQSINEVADCNILYLGHMEQKRLEETLAALKGRSILTVDDTDSSARDGVMIELVMDHNHIRLRINLAAAKAGNLVISSKLLRPAEIINGGASAD